jgi:hypothetical protein
MLELIPPETNSTEVASHGTKVPYGALRICRQLGNAFQWESLIHGKQS